MIEKTFFANNDGYLVLDEEGKTGNFIFYYPPSEKVVIYDVWIDKNNTLKMAHNKRWNNNANILPSNIKEVMEVMAKLGGVDVKQEKKINMSPNMPQKTGQVAPSRKLDEDIKKMGGV